MNIKVLYDDNSYTNLYGIEFESFAKFAEQIFKTRYFVLNDNSSVGNMCIDTTKVRYLEIIK